MTLATYNNTTWANGSYTQDRDTSIQLQENRRLAQGLGGNGVYVDTRLTVGFGFNLEANTAASTRTIVNTHISNPQLQMTADHEEVLAAFKANRPINLPGHVLNGATPSRAQVENALASIQITLSEAQSLYQATIASMESQLDAYMNAGGGSHAPPDSVKD